MLLEYSLIVVLAISSFASADDPQTVCAPGEDGYLTTNPLGTCICDGHLYVSEDCREGYYCLDDTGRGCYKKCPPGEYLVTDIKNKLWFCNEEGTQPNSDGVLEIGTEVKNDIEVHFSFDEDTDKALTRCPVGGYNVCPSTNTAPPLPDVVTGNPIGSCRCNGELWISEGCSYGFFCDDREDIGGFLIECPPGEVVEVDFETNGWSCSTEIYKCPGGQISGVGCTQPKCEYGQNFLGNCDDCEGQLFISDDCTEGFYCSTNIPDPYLYDGCTQKCLNNQVLMPDIANKNWRCVDRDSFDYEFKCPGTFHFECPVNDVGNNFGKDDCECDNQVLMSSDCRESFYCRSRYPSGGIKLACPAGQIVVFDIEHFSWRCSTEVDRCPGLGGYKIGCGAGNEIEPPTLDCDFANNDLGECRCREQLFMNEDCTESFYCSANDEGTEGCSLKCPQGEVVTVDMATRDWECKPKTSDYVCPGEFQTGCRGDSFEFECGCEGEVHMNEECTAAFLCDSRNTGEGNKGRIISCPPGSIVEVTLHESEPTFECTTNWNRCPGLPINFGCKGGTWVSSTTEGSQQTDPSTTTSGQQPSSTEDSTGDDGVALTPVVSLLALLASSLFLMS